MHTDPVVIMLAIDGDRGLLDAPRVSSPTHGRALAGFIEPGETIEYAVRRRDAAKRPASDPAGGDAPLPALAVSVVADDRLLRAGDFDRDVDRQERAREHAAGSAATKPPRC